MSVRRLRPPRGGRETGRGSPPSCRASSSVATPGLPAGSVRRLRPPRGGRETGRGSPPSCRASSSVATPGLPLGQTKLNAPLPHSRGGEVGLGLYKKCRYADLGRRAAGEKLGEDRLHPAEHPVLLRHLDCLLGFNPCQNVGAFRRGDFADFHQRFSLVPRRCSIGRGCLRKELLESVRISYLANIDRCAGKYPPAAREI